MLYFWHFILNKYDLKGSIIKTAFGEVRPLGPFSHFAVYVSYEYVC